MALLSIDFKPELYHFYERHFNQELGGAGSPPCRSLYYQSFGESTMKTVLVTGGCGFIGSNFIHYLLSQEAFKGRIVNVDKLTYAGNPENLAGLDQTFPGRYIFKRTDICDRKALAQIIETFGVDTICHFAAESHVDRSIRKPGGFIRTNIEGTFLLLELCRQFQSQITLFHHVSTDEVYGSLGAQGLFSETTRYDPSSPYSASKAASDHLVMAYHRTYNLPVTLSNCSNNYGPYQFPEKLIPLMIINALEGKNLPVYGDGRNIRDWLYVNDHCAAIFKIMRQGKHGETYNVGGRCERTNLEVVEAICDLLDGMVPGESGKPRRDLITFVKDRPGHDRRYAIDSTKVESHLGWTPRETFETGLRKTIAWYLENREWVARVKSGAYQAWVAEHYA
jgi:dTDP-glucose 4,6-dehydratase